MLLLGFGFLTIINHPASMVKLIFSHLMVQFWIPKNTVQNQLARLEGEEAHHARDVFRMKEGDSAVMRCICMAYASSNPFNPNNQATPKSTAGPFH